MCGWEKRWDQKSRTLILLLLLRTTPSVTIRAMFCPVCLDTLADVRLFAVLLFVLTGFRKTSYVIYFPRNKQRRSDT